ncbi:glutamic acid-rich protein-like [Scylla paramamosain]|uniref:glutamic acid-rich protein-like n=1 Tax=Scylla paramamosain TaxID=85552 RepID=UPI003082DC34
MPGFSTEDFGTTLHNKRFNNNKRKRQAVDAQETLGEKGNGKEKLTTNKKKRRLESLEDCTSHEKTVTEGCAEMKHRASRRGHKNQRDGNDIKGKKTMSVECFHPIMDRTKKRKRQNKDDDEKQNKRKKQDTEETENQDKKRKRQVNDDDEKQNKKRQRQVTDDDEKQDKKRKRLDTEDDEKQDKKRKRQVKDDDTKQDKKRKRQDAEDDEKQAKKSRGEGRRERKKGGKMECCQCVKHGIKRWKMRGWYKDDVVRLMVDAKRVSKERNVSRWCRLNIGKENLVSATVRGHACLVQLDSGSSCSLMRLTLARRLGIVTGKQETVKKYLFTWAGMLELDVIELDEVVVMLRRYVAVNTRMTVIVRGDVRKHSLDLIVMSMSRLQEAEVRQEFHPDDSSILFLRNPKRLRRRQPSDTQHKTFMFAARALDIEEPLTVMVNTGNASTFSITKTGQDKMLCRTGKSTVLPKRVLLHFGSGTDTLRKMDTIYMRHWFDFVFGRTLLCKLQAAIDYDDLSMTLTLNGKRYRFDILTHVLRLRTPRGAASSQPPP